MKTPSTARATHAKSAMALALAFAAALALPTSARADIIADGDAVERPQRQCDAAMETHNRFNMSVYCAIAAEKIAILTIGHPKSDLWADLRTAEAGDLLLAAGSDFRSDSDLAKEQMRSALRIMNEVVALYPNAYRISVRQIIRDAVKTF